jgi:hypothetical protein
MPKWTPFVRECVDTYRKTPTPSMLKRLESHISKHPKMSAADGAQALDFFRSQLKASPSMVSGAGRSTIATAVSSVSRSAFGDESTAYMPSQSSIAAVAPTKKRYAKEKASPAKPKKKAALELSAVVSHVSNVAAAKDNDDDDDAILNFSDMSSTYDSEEDDDEQSNVDESEDKLEQDFISGKISEEDYQQLLIKEHDKKRREYSSKTIYNKIMDDEESAFRDLQIAKNKTLLKSKIEKLAQITADARDPSTTAKEAKELDAWGKRVKKEIESLQRDIEMAETA